MQEPAATAQTGSISVAIEMRNTQWRLAFTAGATAAFLEHLQIAKEKRHVAAPVSSCYEAGRNGFTASSRPRA